MPDNSFASVVDVVRRLTYCSSADAEKAAYTICQEPRTRDALLLACGVSTGAIAIGGRTALGGLAGGVAPVALAGGAVAGAGAMAARRFCSALIREQGRAISNLMRSELEQATGR